MNVGSTLAGIQMPPCLLRRVVVHRRVLLARRARKARSRRLLDPHVDALRRHIHLNSADQPRELDAKQRRIQQPVFHAAVSSSTLEESRRIAP